MREHLRMTPPYLSYSFCSYSFCAPNVLQACTVPC
jgi:hypothetical protein